MRFELSDRFGASLSLMSDERGGWYTNPNTGGTLGSSETFGGALGLEMDGSGFGMGQRSQRYSMIVKDGTVAELNVEQGGGFPVAVLNRNQPAFYCVPAAAYEIMMDKLEDVELAALVNERLNQPEIEVSINDL